MINDLIANQPYRQQKPNIKHKDQHSQLQILVVLCVLHCVYWALIKIPLLILKGFSFNTSLPLALRTFFRCHSGLYFHVAATDVAPSIATIAFWIKLRTVPTEVQSLLYDVNRSARQPGSNEDSSTLEEVLCHLCDCGPGVAHLIVSVINSSSSGVSLISIGSV